MLYSGAATGEITIRRMRIACWVTEATQTHILSLAVYLTICNTYCFSMATVVRRTLLPHVIQTLTVSLSLQDSDKN